MNKARTDTGNVLGYLLLLVLLIASFALGFYLYNENATLKKRMMDNSSVVKEILTSKERLLDEKNTLAEEKARLEQTLATIPRSKTTLASYSTSGELDNIPPEMKELKDYAKEVKELALKRIEYYENYSDGGSPEQAQTISDLQREIEALKYDMALAYVRAKMFDDALKTFQNYIDTHGDNADTYYNMAYIYDLVKHDNTSAIKYYEKYLAMKPDAEDLFEVKMRIASLKRGAKKPENPYDDLGINTEEIKY
ncbi:MAG: hypothetical protein PHH49_04650 [Candidatus Omnitrophica bacterium]|nr:hypothetical protein [Candidatus Omnitrophota bacterium]MDD5488237.1 hypothetical protein [Candidatus Omnitrophota bacterium]